MYLVFIIDRIHNLLNESKMYIFVYNSDQTVYKRCMSCMHNNTKIHDNIYSPVKYRTRINDTWCIKN